MSYLLYDSFSGTLMLKLQFGEQKEDPIRHTVWMLPAPFSLHSLLLHCMGIGYSSHLQLNSQIFKSDSYIYFGITGKIIFIQGKGELKLVRLIAIYYFPLYNPLKINLDFSLRPQTYLRLSKLTI